MAVLRVVCVCLEVTGALAGNDTWGRISNLDGLVVERTETDKSSVHIDRGGLPRNNVAVLGFKRSKKYRRF